MTNKIKETRILLDNVKKILMESKTQIKIPKNIQATIDSYNKKGWWMGHAMQEALLGITDIKKLDTLFKKTYQYASPGRSFIIVEETDSELTIEWVEIDEFNGTKFEKAQNYGVPYREQIGTTQTGKKVKFTYGTVSGGNAKMFSVSDLEEFISINL